MTGFHPVPHQTAPTGEQREGQPNMTGITSDQIQDSIVVGDDKGGRFHQLAPNLAFYLCGEDDLGPEVCPDVLPAGWVPAGEILDFEFQDGDWREVYLLERDE